jgi:dienelactone hydrolase
MKQFKLWGIAGMLLIAASCNNPADKEKEELETPAVKMMSERTVEYKVNDVTMVGFVAYDSADTGRRPAILVVPEWWGLNEYAKGRARQLADLGYVAMAVDMYGNGLQADNPEMAGKLATPFYENPAMARERFTAALQTLKSLAVTDTNKIAAIGYCFGGAQVLNMARLGVPLKGVVSFHGNLVGVPPQKDMVKAAVLVLHGADDQFVPQTEVATFKKQMDSLGIPYIFKAYPGATHAFTNPAATEMGKQFNIPIAYNAAADTASWNEMKQFFRDIF